MEFKKSAAVASAIAVGLVLLAACQSETSKPPGPGGGDDPIVMAGGSMRFISATPSFDYVGGVGGDHKRLKHKKNKTMNQVDILIIANNSAPTVAVVPFNNKTNTIEIYYCDSPDASTGNCATNPGTKVEVQSAGQDVEIIAPSDFQLDPNSNVVEYQPTTVHISQIKINTGPPYDCPAQGKGYCLLVIH